MPTEKEEAQGEGGGMKLVIYIVSAAFIVCSVLMMAGAVALGCADFLGMIQH